jgi:flagellar motor switch protein FliM
MTGRAEIRDVSARRAIPQQSRAPADGLVVTVQDALVAPVAEHSRARGLDPEPYDFRRPLTLAREHARLLEVTFERFARQWGNQLTARLRVLSQVTLADVALRVYDEYLQGLPSPSAVVLCSVEQTRQTALLQLPVECALVWVDYLFGGAGAGDESAGARELTDIELTLVRDIWQRTLDDLGYAFAAVTPLELRVRSVQYQPQFVQALGAADAVVVATFTIQLGERVDRATVMLPAEHLLAAVRQADEGDARDDDDRRAAATAHAQLEDVVQDVPLDVAVRFAPLTVQPRQIADLAVGDVLPLAHPAARPLQVVVDQVVVAHAAVGSSRTRLACRVVTLEENPS